MAPEQALEQSGLDLRADVYGVAAVTYLLSPGAGPSQTAPSRRSPCGTRARCRTWSRSARPGPTGSSGPPSRTTPGGDRRTARGLADGLAALRAEAQAPDDTALDVTGGPADAPTERRDVRTVDARGDDTVVGRSEPADGRGRLAIAALAVALVAAAVTWVLLSALVG